MPRTHEWRRYPARTKNWPPTATLTLNTPTLTQTRVTVNNPTDHEMPILVYVAGTLASTTNVAAGATGVAIDVTHDETTQDLTVRVGDAAGDVIASRPAGA